MGWHIEGTYFENCNCDSICPCATSGLTAPADYERCQVELAFHVDTGEINGIQVGGLTVCLIGDAPQQMSEGGWKIGVLMDAAASPEQAEALGAVFGGQAGGPMAGLAPLIGEMAGMESHEINYSDDGRRHRIRVGDAVNVEVEDFVSPLDPTDRGSGSAASASPRTPWPQAPAAPPPSMSSEWNGTMPARTPSRHPSPGQPDTAGRTALAVMPLPGLLALLACALVAWYFTILAAARMPVGPGTMGLGLFGYLVGWELMMSAMMLPALAPLLGVYLRSLRSVSNGWIRTARTVALVAGYLAVWALFGILAYGAAALGGALAARAPAAAPWVGAVLLAAAGGLPAHAAEEFLPPALQVPRDVAFARIGLQGSAAGRADRHLPRGVLHRVLLGPDARADRRRHHEPGVDGRHCGGGPAGEDLAARGRLQPRRRRLPDRLRPRRLRSSPSCCRGCTSTLSWTRRWIRA